MKKIKLTKLREALNPTYPNNIPVRDTRIGTMNNEPKIGESFLMSYVIKKNGKPKPPGSYFITSEVTEIIDKNTFKTLNSIYQIQILKEKITIKDIL